MTDAKQTKCPHCGSTFRISDAQLAAKGGSVRCGSCLQVFRADLHLVGAPAAAAPAAAPPAAAARPKTKGGPADESWALELLGEKKTPPAAPAPARAAPPAAKAAADEWAMPPGNKAAAGDDDFGFSEDEISAFMTSDADVKAPQGKSLLFDDELSEFLEEAPASGLLGGAEETAHKLSENADESWAQSMLSELEQEEKKESGKQYGMEILDGKSKPAPRNPKLAAALGHRVEGTVPAASPGKGKATGKAAAADDFLGEDADVLSFLDEDDLSSTSAPPPIAPNPFSLERPLANVDAPVVLKPRREPINWGYLLSWTLLCLVAGAMFVAQFVYFNFESLAVQPNVRPYFERVCARFDCRLPDIPDPSKLRTDDLVVRKHPDVPGALIVDAILKNSASFAQPMPSLLLRFRNNADEVVASRLLRPTDYLQGEARMLRRLPPDTPIHISLAIVDPGASAVSYSLEPIL